MLDSIYYLAKYTQHCYECYFITLSKSVSHKSISIHSIISLPEARSYGPQREKICLRGFANSIGA